MAVAEQASDMIKKVIFIFLVLLLLFVVGFSIFLKTMHVPDKGNMENTTYTEQNN
ncbi:MAG: hypothetical protein J6V78_01610 [Clostridia bacterium]|nr:hypothetical protein [Clostridia bacterium]